jgi:integrase
MEHMVMKTQRGHGEGGIDQRDAEGNRWRLRYRVGNRRYSVNFRGSITEARRELRRLIRSADTGEHVAPDKLTLADWADRWMALLRHGEGRRGLVNARTLERYQEMMRLYLLPTLGKRPLQRIAATEIDTLYMRLGEKLAPGTVAFAHRVLNACLSAAVRKDLLLRNPVSKAEPPRKSEEDAGRVLDQDELATLLTGFRNTAMFPIVATAVLTGMRRNELLALRWSDVDLVAKTLTVARSLELTKANGMRFKEPKTARGRRTIAIDDTLVSLLTAEREKYLRIVAGVGAGDDVDLSLIKLPAEALVFPSPVGTTFDPTRPRHPMSITCEFRKHADRLGFEDLRFHDLRGTHETMLLDAGVPVHTAAARCGHDAAVMLRTYARRTKKADTSAAAVLSTLSAGLLR